MARCSNWVWLPRAWPFVPKQILAISAISALFFGILGTASAESISSETYKLSEIQAIVKRQGMQMPLGFLSKISDAQMKYCSEFLDDLTTGKNIEVISPVVSTDNPNDRGLVSYQTSCRNTKNVETNYHELSDLGTHGFRLYRFRRSEEYEILYAEGNPRRFGNGTYYRVNLQQCTARYVTPCCNTTATPNDDMIDVISINGIIRYRRKLYVLDVPGAKRSNDKDFRYGITLWGPLTGSIAPQCEFTRP